VVERPLHIFYQMGQVSPYSRRNGIPSISSNNRTSAILLLRGCRLCPFGLDHAFSLSLIPVIRRLIIVLSQVFLVLATIS